MQQELRDRCEILAEYLVEYKTTVREVAKRFGISKSTVHKDITEKLPAINAPLADLANRVLQVNKAERHIRGGEATRQKYIRSGKKKPASASV